MTPAAYSFSSRLHLARLQPIAAQFDWAKQRRMWRELLTATDSDPVRR
jgi:hypothetical protein